MDTRRYKILIIDDLAENRRILAQIITKSTDYEVLLASDGRNINEKIADNVPDLILLDIMMPGLDGYGVARELKNNPVTVDIPIIFITAITDTESIVKAFKSGGVDYITKPFNKEELLARVNAQLELKRMRDDLKEKNFLLANREAQLEKLVEEKTERLERLTYGLVSALESANYYNDSDTGNHIRRVSRYSGVIAELYGLEKEFVKKIVMYSSLHDVGKVGIDDAILKKPGKFSPEEFKRMQEHVVIGARMLQCEEMDPIARNIVKYHHEKWDGTGYVEGLKGERIPLEARIVAVADVYDALGSKRPYKKAFTEEKIDKIMREEAGKHFDPDLIEVFFAGKEKILEIKHLLHER